MEWGNFWSSHLPRTSYDIDLDVASPNPNDKVKFLSIGHSVIIILLSSKHHIKDFAAGF